MNTIEIFQAQEFVLRTRLKDVSVALSACREGAPQEDVAALDREADEIRRELSRRYGGCA